MQSRNVTHAFYILKCVRDLRFRVVAQNINPHPDLRECGWCFLQCIFILVVIKGSADVSASVHTPRTERRGPHDRKE